MPKLKSHLSKLTASLPALGYLLFTTPVLAQRQAPSEREVVNIGERVSGFFGFQCITELVFRFVDAAIIGAGILLLVYLVYGGVEWLTSGGDKAKIESARAKITNALIGVAIIAAAFAVWKIVLTFFGIDAPNICSADPFGATRLAPSGSGTPRR